MTRSELRKIIRDDGYINIPSMLAYNNSLGKPWWRNLEELKKEAAKAMIWECCQIIAVLFDTYGDAIDSVSVKVDVEQDKNDIYMATSVYVNNKLRRGWGIGLEDRIRDRCDEVDDHETFYWVLGELHEAMWNSGLMSELGAIKTAFGQTFTSADQAREVARKAAPEINKWFTSRLLAKQAQDKIEVPSDKRVGPKL